MAIDYTRMHRHTVTHWPKGTPDGYGGYSYGAPVQITARWQDGRSLHWAIGQTGDQINALAYSTTAIKVDDFLYLGTSTSTDPTTVDDANIVKDVYAGSALDGVRRLYRAVM